MLLLLSFAQISLVCVCPAPDTFPSLLSLLTGKAGALATTDGQGEKEELGLVQLSC